MNANISEILIKTIIFVENFLIKKTIILLMKKFLSLLVVLGLISGSYAQEVKMTMSETQKKVQMLHVGRINDKNYVVTQNFKEKNYALDIYNDNLTLLQSSVFKEKGGEKSGLAGKGFDYLNTLFMKDRVLIFFTTFEKTSKQRLLICQKVDLNGKFEGDFTQIDEIQAKRKGNSGNFAVYMSEDSTQFLALQLTPYEKNAEEEMYVTTFDSNLKKIAAKKVNLPYKDKNTRVIGARVSNNGDVFMLVNVIKERKEKTKGSDNDFFSIIGVNFSSDNSLVEYNLEMKKKNITDAGFRIDNENNQLLVTGFYSNIKTNAVWTNDIDGSFIMRIDIDSKKIAKENQKDFPKELVNQLAGRDLDKKVKAGQGISNRFDIVNMLKRDDNSMLVVAENRWIDAITTCTNNVCITTYVYHNRNILLIDVDADGKIKSFYDIPKRQVMNNTSFYQSFLTMQKHNEFIFVFNDNPKNIDKKIINIKDVKAMNNPGKACLSFIRLSENGKLSRENVTFDKKSKITVAPKFGVRVSEGQYIMPYYKKNDFGILKLEF